MGTGRDKNSRGYKEYSREYNGEYREEYNRELNGEYNYMIFIISVIGAAFIRIYYRIKSIGKSLKKISKLGIEIMISLMLSKRSLNLILGGYRSSKRVSLGGGYNA